MLFFLQKPPTNTQNVYMKYIMSYLKILNIAVHNYYTECCFLCRDGRFSECFC